MNTTPNHLILSSTTIEGTNVRNLSDEKLGDIKDIMLDVNSGRIAYAVVAVSEGFLGLDSKYFAIPWQALRFDTDREIALLDVSAERLKNSPGFDKDHWPSTPQREFVDEVHSFYGYEPFYGRSTGESVTARGMDPSFNYGAADENIRRDRDINDPNYNRDLDEPKI